MQLQGRRIIVTGCASGMGAATVRAYVHEGAAVLALDVDDDAGEALVASLQADASAPLLYRHCDVRDAAATQDASRTAVSALGGIDVLAHAAAVWQATRAESVTEADWAWMFDVNVKGTANINQAVFTAMRDGGGHIINFGSASGVVGSPGASHYSASKGAVLAWTRTIAREWATHGIRANAVAPAIWTPMYELRRAELRPDEVEAYDRDQLKHIPLGGRLGDPDLDFAPVMVFLASNGARFITGQTLPVSGGSLILT